MRGFSFDLKGADKQLSKLDKLPTKMQVKVDETMKYNVAEINDEQVARAPIDTGRLRGSITFFRISPMNYVLEAGVDYAAYVEFGTGGAVKVPSELSSYAAQFKGKGAREVNLPARPFFFPPFLSKRKQIVDDIKRELGRL